MSIPISMFVRGAVVLAVALAVVRLMRPAPASLRHAVLAFALAAVVALPAIAAIVPTCHAGAIAGSTPGETFAPELPVAEPGPATGAAGTTAAPTEPPARPIPWRAIAGGIWLAGVALGVLRIAIGGVRARGMVARGTVLDDVGADAAWRALGGRGEAPPVVVSDDIDAPIVAGAVAAVVVVPFASSAWSAERWRLVLVHELAHVRRRDGLATVIARLSCCVHWFDPLAWMAVRRLRVERELAADDAVLRDGARASTYAEHLLEIASGGRREVSGALAMAGRFEARIVAMLDGARARGAVGAGRSVAIAGAAFAIAAIAACVSPEPAPVAAPAGGSASAPAADPALAAVAEAELDHAIAAHHASGALAIVLDAKTGTPLVIATRGAADAHAPRVPGSTMKPFTIAAALDAGVVDVTAHVDCENGARSYGDQRLTDASPHGVLDLGGVIAVSSNICTAKIAEPLGDRLGEALRRYHFAAPAHVDTRSLDGASIAGGEGVRVSPLDVAAGYTAFADGGAYHAPDGSSGDAGERVMSEPTSRAVLAMLARVVDGADGTGHAARIDGVRVAGKTGTAETGVAGRYYASFVGIVPADAPRFVVLVGVDGVTGAGGEVAATVFARIASRALGQ